MTEDRQYPQEATDAGYVDVLTREYPFHPSLIDALTTRSIRYLDSSARVMPSACLLEPSTSGITSPTVSTATGFGFTTSQSLMTILAVGFRRSFVSAYSTSSISAPQ